jgi:hypothetical protein
VTTITISGIHDITVDAYRETVYINIKTSRGDETTRLEQERDDAELLFERLGEALNKIPAQPEKE